MADKSKKIFRGQNNQKRHRITESINKNIPKTTFLENLITNISSSTQSSESSASKHSFYDLTTARKKTEFGTDTIKLLLIEPHFLFTYWEVSDKVIFSAKKSTGAGAKLTLRYYDITDSHDLDRCKHWDIEVFDRIGKWYLRLEQPQQRLHLELGLKGGTKNFTKIASADFMFIPQDTLNAPGAQKWVEATSETMPIKISPNDYQLSEAEPELLKRIMGPYFFNILKNGNFSAITNTSTEALFPIINEPSSN